MDPTAPLAFGKAMRDWQAVAIDCDRPRRHPCQLLRGKKRSFGRTQQRRGQRSLRSVAMGF